MQLRKRARRLAPTYDKINFPSGTRRQDSDFNQERNTHPTNNRGVQPRRRFFTPREMDMLCAVGFDAVKICETAGTNW